jgi:hypothetical protein
MSTTSASAMPPSYAALSFRGFAVPALAMAAITIYTLTLTIVVVPGNVDTSWLIVASERLLAGERMHIDLIETNPPFSIWLYMPFVWLQNMVGLSAEVWLGLGVTTAALGSVLLSARILVRADPYYGRGLAVWMLPAAYFSVLALYPDQFGQREQFALIGFLPWLALQCARDRDPDCRAGTWFDKLTAGLGAAFVVVVKPPYYVLAILLPSAFLAIRHRSIRPLFVVENLIGAAISTLYVGYVLVFDEAYVELFRTLLSPVYLPARAPFVELVKLPGSVLIMLGVAIVAAGGIRRLDRDARLLFIAASGFIPAYFFMGKGWAYHSIPFVVLGILATALQFARPETAKVLPTLRRSGARLGVAFAAFLLLMSQSRMAYDLWDYWERNGDGAKIIRSAVHEPTMFTISAGAMSSFPLARLASGRFVGRNPSLWTVYNTQEMIENETDQGRIASLQAKRDGFIADIARELADKKPEILVYYAWPEAGWSELILQNPAMATELANYRVLHQHLLMTYYIRSDIQPRG